MVKVALRRTASGVLRRLERAGLRVHQAGAGWVIGSVAVDKLGALAELYGVEQVTLP